MFFPPCAGIGETDPVGVTKHTENSKGHANNWIAYPFTNTNHFAANYTVNRYDICLIKTLSCCDATIKKAPCCRLKRQDSLNILHCRDAANEAK
jgi:hypothetical protein